MPKIGSGTDGTLYLYEKLALIILKYDNETRKKRGRMAFDKVTYFIQELKTKRITFPKDILLDENGIYCGIVMDYLDKRNENNLCLSQFQVDALVQFVEELILDIELELTPKKVVPNDINFGSYCVTSSFFQLCDTDKYLVAQEYSSLKNQDKMHYILAKSIYYLIFYSYQLNQLEKRKWQKWVKLQVREKKFYQTLQAEIKENHFENMEEYLSYKRKIILK